METLLRIFRIKELRNALLFVLFILVVFRIAAHIPIPGIDASELAGVLAGNQFLGLLNVFSGGTLMGFSVVALGLGPYITSSIVFQLLGMIFPSFEELQKEEQGRQKINRWSRFATVPLALLQGYALLRILGSQGAFAAGLALTPFEYVTALVCMTAGTVFLMWLGELISEKKIGNGVSILIFAGIVAAFPGYLGQLVGTYTDSQLVNTILIVALTVVTIVGVVVISEGQRKIPVQYARGGAGGGGSKVQSFLPLRINMGGMIPIIFALSILVLPPLVSQFFMTARTTFVREAATWVIQLFNNQLFYGLFYFSLVVAFTFFYASVVFKPDQVAENLQKQGGFIPGVRPGEQTARYLHWTVNRVLLTGAVFLGLIAVLPVIVQQVTGNPNLVIGGSSVIIVVSVVIEMVKQIEAQLSMRSYDIS